VTTRIQKTGMGTGDRGGATGVTLTVEKKTTQEGAPRFPWDEQKPGDPLNPTKSCKTTKKKGKGANLQNAAKNQRGATSYGAPSAYKKGGGEIGKV